MCFTQFSEKLIWAWGIEQGEMSYERWSDKQRVMRVEDSFYAEAGFGA